MNPYFQCGNRTSHSLLGEGDECEVVRLHEDNEYEFNFSIWFVKCNNCNKHSLFSLLEGDPEESTSLWPKKSQVDHAVPDEIRVAYEEANKVRRISKIAYVILIRRALEVLCKYERATGRDLYKRIQNLGVKGTIPTKLTDMADLKRLLGNEGAHDSELKIDDHEIDLLGEFLQAIIEYVYIAPEKVKKLKEKLKK